MENNIEVQSQDNENLGLKSIIIGYVRKWKVFLWVFLLSFIPAILYLVLMPRTYEMVARIQLQDTEAGGGSFGLGEAAGLMKSFGLGGGSAGSVNLEDEMAVLSSNQLIRQTIYALGMDVQYKHPDAFFYNMYTNSPLLLTYDSVTATQVLDKIEFKVNIAADGKVQVRVKSKEDKTQHLFEFASLPGVMKLNQGEFRLAYRNLDQQVKPYKMKIKIKPAYWVAEDYVEEILVEELSKSANTVELTLQDYERRRGLDFLNTHIRIYNEQDKSIRKNESDKSMQFIDSRMQQVMAELHVVEEEIERFKTLHNMTDLEYDIQFYVAQMQEIQVKMIELEMQNMMIKAMDDFVKDPANEYNQIPMLLSATEGESGGAILLYNTKLLERMQILKSSTEKSPLVDQMNEQVVQLREGAKLTISNAQESLKSTLVDLKNKEKMIFDKMGEVPGLEKEYINYKRQQEIYQGVYLLLLQKREDIAISLGEMKDRARIVDTAFVREKPVGPRKLYAALAMMVMTLIFPLIWIEGKKLFVELKKEYKRSIEE
ncbi:tyrosine-protein kinase Etk/Wzc [Parabacteroides sp. PFB2-12]|uniref:GumC family protein n=1 Tax=unclassified Parabacteroides TaxID=2649774 RepID=UPI002473F6D7|nr:MULTISPECIES: tyrosine protein kinase [unclassified Parabacteroides]MDH6343481.1 tyrosine-protein kinase Etk/Wzc [Parabacteroides sp. PM6-13]MDH6390919.1 tyrosine-protein kinase Etk/Wzc [Parabacteroides sp. PFB2-12]